MTSLEKLDSPAELACASRLCTCPQTFVVEVGRKLPKDRIGLYRDTWVVVVDSLGLEVWHVGRGTHNQKVPCDADVELPVEQVAGGQGFQRRKRAQTPPRSPLTLGQISCHEKLPLPSVLYQ